MKRSLGAILDLLMCRGPLPWLGRRWNRDRLVVLAYHGVDDRSSFAAHLDQLMRLYHVVSLDQVLSSIENGGLPPNSVLITFDDGERTVLTDGLPELQKRSLPSVLFAIAGLIDTERAILVVGSRRPRWPGRDILNARQRRRCRRHSGRHEEDERRRSPDVAR